MTLLIESHFGEMHADFVGQVSLACTNGCWAAQLQVTCTSEQELCLCIIPSNERGAHGAFDLMRVCYHLQRTVFAMACLCSRRLLAQLTSAVALELLCMQVVHVLLTK